MMTEKDERMWGMITHLSGLAGWFGNGIGWILLPLIIWLIKRDESPFVDEQGKEAINFQISFAIYAMICGILIYVLIGIPMIILLSLAQLVLVIIASIKAKDGVSYRYPATIRFLK